MKREDRTTESLTIAKALVCNPNLKTPSLTRLWANYPITMILISIIEAALFLVWMSTVYVIIEP